MKTHLFHACMLYAMLPDKKRDSYDTLFSMMKECLSRRGLSLSAQYLSTWIFNMNILTFSELSYFCYHGWWETNVVRGTHSRWDNWWSYWVHYNCFSKDVGWWLLMLLVYQNTTDYRKNGKEERQDYYFLHDFDGFYSYSFKTSFHHFLPGWWKHICSMPVCYDSW